MRAMVATTWRSGSTFLGRRDHHNDYDVVHHYDYDDDYHDDYDDHHHDDSIQPTKYWLITNLLNFTPRKKGPLLKLMTLTPAFN